MKIKVTTPGGKNETVYASLGITKNDIWSFTGMYSDKYPDGQPGRSAIVGYSKTHAEINSENLRLHKVLQDNVTQLEKKITGENIIHIIFEYPQDFSVNEIQIEFTDKTKDILKKLNFDPEVIIGEVRTRFQEVHEEKVQSQDIIRQYAEKRDTAVDSELDNNIKRVDLIDSSNANLAEDTSAMVNQAADRALNKTTGKQKKIEILKKLTEELLKIHDTTKLQEFETALEKNPQYQELKKHRSVFGFGKTASQQAFDDILNNHRKIVSAHVELRGGKSWHAIDSTHKYKLELNANKSEDVRNAQTEQGQERTTRRPS